MPDWVFIAYVCWIIAAGIVCWKTSIRATAINHWVDVVKSAFNVEFRNDELHQLPQSKEALERRIRSIITPKGFVVSKTKDGLMVITLLGWSWGDFYFREQVGLGLGGFLGLMVIKMILDKGLKLHLTGEVDQWIFANLDARVLRVEAAFRDAKTGRCELSGMSLRSAALIELFEIRAVLSSIRSERD